MISWNDLSKTLERMPGLHLKNLEVQTCSDDVSYYPITAAVLVVAAPAPTPIPAAARQHVDIPAVPTLPAPAPTEIVEISEARPREIKLTAAKHSIDPIILGINLVDPMYEGAPHTTRHNIEKEIAVKLESELDSLYKTNSGRSRGWTKVGLEAMIKPRCASGGDLKEIDRAKKPFIWALAQEDKGMSAFLDFVCCARRIHCVVVDSEKRVGYLYPAADNLDSEEKVDIPLFLVDTTGHPLFGIRNATELMTFMDKNSWKLLPPHSVVHSLSGLKLDELESVGKRLGMSTVEGSKAERVTAIAAFKTRARLSTH
jgi:hypothetical protein